MSIRFKAPQRPFQGVTVLPALQPDVTQCDREAPRGHATVTVASRGRRSCCREGRRIKRRYAIGATISPLRPLLFHLIEIPRRGRAKGNSVPRAGGARQCMAVHGGAWRRATVPTAQQQPASRPVRARKTDLHSARQERRISSPLTRQIGLCWRAESRSGIVARTGRRSD